MVCVSGSLAALTVGSTALWDLTPCNPVEVYRLFAFIVGVEE
jgi:hypothetical protein